MLKPGIKHQQKFKVTPESTAKAYGSGGLEVLATPAMIALMEGTALKSVEDYLAPGESTVGTKVNISHLAASVIGTEVTCESELIEVDRRRLVFTVTVSDSIGIVGEGTHERFIVGEKFMEKAMARGAE